LKGDFVESVADDLLAALKIADRLRSIDDAAASKRPAPGKWSGKEILGHLIDSAANNHQRFVRLQLGPSIGLPGYDGDEWVRIQAYQERPWHEIIELWRMYNIQLASLIRRVDRTALRNVWHMPDGKDADLEFIMRDYVVHLRHHLEQIVLG
jgi:DinB family protein